MQTNIKRMTELIEVLNKASTNYYTSGESQLSDLQWDKLYNELLSIQKETGIVLSNSPSVKIGANPTTSFEQHKHISPLWSMDKVQNTNELAAWLNRCEKLFLSSQNIKQEEFNYVVEYKLDGLTVNLTYENGEIVQAATRGNGEIGEVILTQVQTIRNVPHTIPYKGLLEVQGECIMRLSVLNEYNKTATEPLKNARNAAAGALRNLDPTVTAKRKLDIFFYQVGTIENPPYKTHQGMLDFLTSNGFPISPFSKTAKNPQEIKAIIDEIEAQRETLDYLIDGAVVKVSSLSIREEMGYTEKFPRWCVAFKYTALENISTLLDVKWQLGRTGKLTPLAILEPTEIGGVTIQRATLNNYNDILKKQVAIGCKVWIRRSNDVIPEITGRVGEITPEETEIIPPVNCPACGSTLLEKGAHLFCMNRDNCKPQAIARLVHFSSRNAMDIDGFSEKTAELLYEYLSIRNTADLYFIKKEDIVALDGFQQKKSENLINSIEKSKNCSLDSFIFALGIPNVGKKTAKDLASNFNSLDNLIKATEDDLVNITDIGDIVSSSIVEYFSFSENMQNIQRLLDAGVTFNNTPTKTTNKLNGLIFVVTGTLPTLSRIQAEDLITSNGGTTSTSVSKKTSYLLAGEKAGSKLDKAAKLNIKIISENDFYEMINDNN